MPSEVLKFDPRRRHCHRAPGPSMDCRALLPHEGTSSSGMSVNATRRRKLAMWTTVQWLASAGHVAAAPRTISRRTTAPSAAFRQSGGAGVPPVVPALRPKYESPESADDPISPCRQQLGVPG